LSEDGFIDLFSGHAAQYSSARPRYPRSLFQRIAAAAPALDRAWDCGTGNGQAAIDLAAHFTRVDASDASAEQIASAKAHDRVHYSVQAAERSNLPDASIDVITVATALHWFDLPEFLHEVGRVLKPGGLLVVWSYLWPRVDSAVDEVFDAVVLSTVESYWAPEAEKAKSGYSDVPLPYPEIDLSSPPIRAEWNLDQMMALIYSWSATRACIAAEGDAVMARFETALREVWGAPKTTRALEIPVMVRATRKPG
jgi:SAM-dependent methyltransferase